MKNTTDTKLFLDRQGRIIAAIGKFGKHAEEVVDLRDLAKEQSELLIKAKEALLAADECIRLYSHPGSKLVAEALEAIKNFHADIEDQCEFEQRKRG